MPRCLSRELWMGLVALLLPAQETIFRTGVTLVKVDAAVTDHGGKAIPNLTREDFEIFDEGQPQKITYFEHESEPLDLLLLLDVSGSMSRSLTELAAAALDALRPLTERDRVAVMFFARTSAVRQPFTQYFSLVQEGLEQAVKRQDLGSGTAINAAIVAAAGYIGQEPVRGRRAILIVSDNLGLNYRVPDEEVVRALYAADTTLDAIVIGKQGHPVQPRPGQSFNTDFTPADVFKLAEQTGGEAIRSRHAGESLQTMIERIRLRYRLEYPAPPAAPGQLRHIHVQLAGKAGSRHPRAEIRARAGYYAIQ